VSRHAGPRALAAAVAALALAPAAAGAAPRWVVANERPVPLTWFQGLTHAPAGDRFFVGVFVGVTRTDAALRPQLRVEDVIPPAVRAAYGFNHVGDPTWDRAEGGRLLLPLECYTPGAPGGGNTCGRGAIGIADPATLAWRGTVLLDQQDIAKAMWAEVSPDGRLLWTSSGPDLLAYRTADVSAASAAAATPIRPVLRLPGAVPPSGVTGAAFAGRRLLLAGQNGLGPLQVWSVDVDGDGSRRLELELPVAMEAEGLDVVASGDGLLHWLLSPFAPGGRPPTYGAGHSEIVSFVRRGQSRLRVLAGRTAAGDLAARVVLRLRSRSWPVEGATVTAAGASATTDADGRVRLALPAGLRRPVRVVARKAQLRPGRAVVPLSRGPRLAG
jgi:hypothetical protein